MDVRIAEERPPQLVVGSARGSLLGALEGAVGRSEADQNSEGECRRGACHDSAPSRFERGESPNGVT